MNQKGLIWFIFSFLFCHLSRHLHSRMAEAFFTSSKSKRIAYSVFVLRQAAKGNSFLTAGHGDDTPSLWDVADNRIKDNEPKDEKRALLRLPSVATLDFDGPLPPDAYVHAGDLQFEPKATCRISVAVPSPTLESDFDYTDQILAVQRFVDSGLTSFHLQSMSLCRLIQNQTPKSVLQGVDVTVPLSLSSIRASGSCRRMIKELLSECGAEALDNVQVVCDQSQSLYLLDALDELHDLRREGLVRCVSARNMACDQVRMAAECGFPISSNAVPGSIFQSIPPELLHPDIGSVAAEEPPTPPTIITSPLAGGFLSGRYLGRSLPSSISGFESRPCLAPLLAWGRRRSRAKGHEALNFATLWNEYQETLTSLNEIARHYYGVDIATIALRWLLQHGLSHHPSISVLSAVVSTNLPPSTGFLNRYDARPDDIESRIRSLRRVFSFELSEEDMYQIFDLSLWNVMRDMNVPELPPHLRAEALSWEQEKSRSDVGNGETNYRKLWL